MSVISCASCGQSVDTDFKEVRLLDDVEVCEPCYENQEDEARSE